jgi:pimeloyl-ACP methyl ester carboxylesterase
MTLIEASKRSVDYDERGNGPAIVFVPGSCSTGAAWRPIIAALGNGYRCITTSLPGYGGTAERRTADDGSIDLLAEAVEEVAGRAGSPVHLVGHSFGGLVSLAVALRARIALASLSLLEVPAFMLLRSAPKDAAHDLAFRGMTRSYFASFADGDRAAIGQMIDFYGGAGTFASWPDRVRNYAIETTAVNIRDWHSSFAFPPADGSLAALTIPTLVLWGSDSHPATQRANEILAGSIAAARSAVIPGAAHFMIATHAREVASLLARHVDASR